MRAHCWRATTAAAPWAQRPPQLRSWAARCHCPRCTDHHHALTCRRARWQLHSSALGPCGAGWTCACAAPCALSASASARTPAGTGRRLRQHPYCRMLALWLQMHWRAAWASCMVQQTTAAAALNQTETTATCGAARRNAEPLCPANLRHRSRQRWQKTQHLHALAAAVRVRCPAARCTGAFARATSSVAVQQLPFWGE